MMQALAPKRAPRLRGSGALRIQCHSAARRSHEHKKEQKIALPNSGVDDKSIVEMLFRQQSRRDFAPAVSQWFRPRQVDSASTHQ